MSNCFAGFKWFWHTNQISQNRPNSSSDSLVAPCQSYCTLPTTRLATSTFQPPNWQQTIRGSSRCGTGLGLPRPRVTAVGAPSYRVLDCRLHVFPLLHYSSSVALSQSPLPLCASGPRLSSSHTISRRMAKILSSCSSSIVKQPEGRLL